MDNFWGFFGDGDMFNFGVFWGFIPENPRKILGDFLGTGMTSILGIFGVYPRKTPIFGDGDGDRATKRFGDGLGTGIV